MMFSRQQYDSGFLKSVALVAVAAALSACGGGGSDRDRRVGTIGTELRSAQFVVNESLGSVSFAGGNTLNLSLSVGSGAFHVPDDDRDVFYTITDRGPTVPCTDTGEVIGVDNFCSNSNGSVFAQPEFRPQILRWKLAESGNNLTLDLVERTTLRDQFNNPVEGVPPSFSQALDEIAYDPNGNQLQRNPNGMDPEALVRLNNGRFWIAEEYGPSLVLVESDGEVVERQVPAGIASDLNGSTFDVKEDILPAIYAKRGVQRGIAALTVSPDNSFLYFVMKGPLANPNAAAVEDSRIVRVGKVSLNANGTPNALVGEYLYRLDSAAQYDLQADGETAVQSDVTVNEMSAVATDDLLLVEQAGTASKVFRINLANAASIQGSEFDSPSTSPSLEQQQALEDYPFVVKQPVFNSATDPRAGGIDEIGTGFEGFAILNSDFAAVTTDNEYGLRGVQSKIVVLPIPGLLNGTVSPVAPVLSYENSAIASNGADFDVNAADIVVANPSRERMFVANNAQGSIDVFSLATPLSPTLSSELDIAEVATSSGITAGRITAMTLTADYLVVTIANANAQEDGVLALYDLTTLGLTATYDVGPSPAAIAADRTAARVFVANEGVPNNSYSVDPEGSVSVLDFRSGVTSAIVTEIDFQDFNTGGSRADELPEGVLITGPGATVAQDLEPGSLSTSLDGSRLYVVLQENNAVAKINVASLEIESITAFGSKDFGGPAAGLDTNNNGLAQINSRPGVVGLFQAGSVDCFNYSGQRYYLTANTGAPRQYAGFNEVVPAADLDGFNGPAIDSANPSIGAASNNSEIGRLQVSNVTGDTDNDGDIDEISAFGGRSFSIWNDDGQLVFDSGDDIAQITQAYLGNDFNNRDAGSISQGAKPSAAVLVGSQGRVYAFIVLEASGGVLVYDVTSPFGAQFVQYINNRSFASDPQFDTGDIGPANIAVYSDTSGAYLLVANGRSGTVRVFEVGSTLDTE